MAERIIIEGQPATITYDPDLGMYRGEFTELSGSADFYADTRVKLAVELASLLETMRSIHEVGAIDDGALNSFESTVGISRSGFGRPSNR